MMALQEIFEVEPELTELERDILLSQGESRDQSAGPLPGFKQRLCRLVGFEARNPALGPCQAYDVVYTHLFSIFEGSPRLQAGGENHHG